jgi:hypothetical protein
LSWILGAKLRLYSPDNATYWRIWAKIKKFVVICFYWPKGKVMLLKSCSNSFWWLPKLPSKCVNEPYCFRQTFLLCVPTTKKFSLPSRLTRMYSINLITTK